MFKWSVQKRLLLMGSVIAAGMLATSAFAIRDAKTLLASLDDVSATQLPAVRWNTLADMMHDGIRGVVMEAFLAGVDSDWSRVGALQAEGEEKVGQLKTYIQALQRLPVREETHRAVEATLPLIEKYTKISRLILGLLQKKQLAEARGFKPQFDESFGELEVKMELVGELVSKDAYAQRDGGRNAVAHVTWASVLVALFLLVLLTWIARSINRDLAGVVERIAEVQAKLSSAGQSLNSSARATADASIEQASAVQESASSLAEMSKMVAANLSQTNLALQKSQEVSTSSEKGQKTIESVRESMKAIQESNVSLQNINDMIRQIESKTAVINDIVFKTQLLSFNASIEAARAGAHGKGFSVVAEEVSSLALMSGQAAREVDSLIRETQESIVDVLNEIDSRVKKGNEISRQAQEGFFSITGNIRDVNELINRCVDASSQQSSGLQQSTVALRQIEQSAQRNAASANSVAVASQDLLGATRQLEETMKFGQELIGSSGKRSAPPKEESAQGPTIELNAA